MKLDEIISKKKRHEPFFLGTGQVLAGACMTSFSAVFVKLTHVGPTTSAFYRVFFGGIVLLLFALIARHRLRVGWRPFGLIALCGLFFALDLAIWHRSVLYIGPGLSTILANFQVFFLGVFGIFILKETPTIRYIISVPLAFYGLILIVGFNWSVLESSYKAGLLLGILTALAYSCYLITLRNLQSLYQNLSSYAVVALISIVTAFFLVIQMMTEGASYKIPDIQSWATLLAYGIMCQGLGWVLISKGIGKITASRAGLILLLQPTLTFIWDVLLFNRPTDLVDILGALMAIVAIYLGSAK